MNLRNPLIRQRDGRRLVAAQGAHALGQGVVAVTIPWLVLESGGSVLQAGLALALTFLPFLALAVPAGLAGDRLGRRGLMAGAMLAAAAVAIGVAAWVGLGGAPPLAALYATAFAIGAARVFVDAAMFGALAALSERGDLVPAQAALAAAFNLGYYGGPALGGAALVAGGGWALALAAAALAAGAMCARGISARADRRPATARGARRALRLGVAALATAPGLRAITATGLAWSVAWGGVVTLAVPHLRAGLGAGGAGLGVVLAAGVACMTLSVPLLTRLDRRHADTRILLGSCLLAAVPVAAFGLAPGLPAATLAYGPMLLAGAVCGATLMGARARRVPDDAQALAGVAGRTLVISGMAAGAIAASLVAEALSTGAAYLALAAALAGTGLVARRPLTRAASGAVRTAPALVLARAASDHGAAAR